MQISKKTGLVLEGGGMRGVFTSGVLDAFMKHDLYFPYVVAVSAGACNGLSYMSRQPRRARFSKTYRENPAIYEVVTTNCLTGRAEYLSEKQDADRLTAIIKASSSLPYVAQITHVDGIPMLDGGIVDSIPVVRAIDKGYSPNVVIMTRNRGFRSAEPDFKVPRLFYKQYPRLRVVLSHHVKAYNEQLDLIERMEDWGEVVCIRPERPMEVDRICRDVSKLEALYEEGFALGEKFCADVLLSQKK